MNWLDAVNKKPTNIQNIEKPEEDYEEVVEMIHDFLFKNPEEEFEIEHKEKMVNIKVDFRNFIEEHYLPFFDNIHNNEYNMFDFLKLHSNNFDKIKEKVEEENRLFEEEIIKENEEIEKELEEEDIEFYDEKL